ncbi:MAG: thiamine pyrophosphate-dependent dehydrogenase E1 component subunit alpha [Oligoflexia bacterium]|nr:thiamine pyrophosphate-dependent dehydrogenase E1 component subunit alpha [Oligoflexia bacterium]
MAKASSQLPYEKIYQLMVKSRVLEERLIKIYKSGEGYFWIGGPGQEAFDVSLGLQMRKGQGLDYDYFHGHYRSAPVLVAMGLEMIDGVRLMKNLATDKSTGGRNFCNHYAIPEWNIVPITSPIEVQYSMALGTAWAQRRHGGQGITIVTGGDAGTAEGDFASCLIWASRPGSEVPLLILVEDNKWGISTSAQGQHGEKNIADRAKAFNIKSAVVDGNSVEESWQAIEEAMNYVRTKRKPYFLQANLSRLYGHSSASGANFVSTEGDCIKLFEEELKKKKLIDDSKIKSIFDKYQEESMKALELARTEAPPTPESVWEYVFKEKNDPHSNWRGF